MIVDHGDADRARHLKLHYQENWRKSRAIVVPRFERWPDLSIAFHS
jgi:hypothetical protein